MAYIGNTPGVSSQRTVQREVIAGSPKSAFIVTSGYSLGYVDVFVNGSQLDEADFTAADGVTVTLAQAAAVGDIVRIIAWLPRGLSDGYLKSETDALLLTKAPLASPTFTGLVTTAGQIKFPATQNASSDANTLDDYEEGTFTPSITGTTSAGVGTYQTRSGKYVKVGRAVTITITLQWSAHTGTGNMLVTGLPFTADASAGVSIRSDAIGMSANSYMTSSIEDGTTYILMVQTVTGTTNGNNIPMDSTGFLIIGASYIAIA